MVKQKSFQEMYNKIQMNEEQKNRIWEQVKTRSQSKKARAKDAYHMPAFTALCTCLVLLIGVPVLAANTSVLERITAAFRTLSGNEEDLTEEQKSIYKEYGVMLDETIPLTGHAVTLEAVIYDGYDICIPFSITPLEDAEKEIEKASDKLQSGMALADLNSLLFYAPEHKIAPSVYIVLDEAKEQGKTTGCYLLSSKEKLIPGDTLLIQKQATPEKTPDTVSTLTMETPVASREILSETSRIELENKVTIDSICFSPLSLHLTGTAPNPVVGNAVYSGKITVEKRDGSEIKQTHSGTSHSLRNNEKDLYTFEEEVLFASPADLEDVAGIRIKNYSLDLWIPVEKDDKQ